MNAHFHMKGVRATVAVMSNDVLESAAETEPVGDVSAGPTAHDAGYRRGERGYVRITSALFAAGMATFVSMYAAQAVLPALSQEYDVSPATSALAVSATTGLLAFSIVPASILSERFGRTRVMAVSALLSAVIGTLLPLTHSMEWLIVARALQGITLAGVPAVAMAHLAEEVAGDSLGAAMGRYIAGTTLGGLAGRLVTSFALDVTTWRWALEVSAAVALVFTGVFVRLAPRSRFFEPKPIGLRASLANVATHLRNPRIMALVGSAFVLMGGFVSLYNVLAFRLLASPFTLPQTIVGLVFLMYLAGTVSSSWAGRLGDRYGREQVLLGSLAVMAAGLVLTLPNQLAAVLAGMLLFTAGFFAAHSTASGWVGVLAHRNRAEASSLYLFGYYTGSSVLGALTGLPFARYGWTGAVAFVGALVLLGCVLAVPLMRRRA